MAGTSSTFGGVFAQQQMATFPSPTQPRHQTAQPGNMSKQTSTTSGSNNFASTNGATSGLSFPSMDLSGKLIIKIRIEGDDDVRRIPIHNEDITYDELLLMMQRVFVGKVTSSDDVVVKYRDDDGDFITMADNSDLTIAKQCSRILHLKIYIRGKMFPHISGCSCDVNDVRQQLIKIRDHVNYLLDLVVPDASKHESGPTIEQPAPIDTTGQDPSRPVDQAGLSVAQTLFDPLKQQQQQQQQPPQAQQPPQQSPAASDHSGAVMQAVQAAPVATPVSSATEPVGTASAIADSFGLSADEMAPPPEQPNAPPSDAMTTGTYPPSQQQQQPSSQAQPQQTGQQQQQQQMPPTSSGYPGSSTAAYPASGAAPPSTSASAPPPTGYPAASFSGNAATTSPAASYYNQPGSQGPPQATQPPSNPYGGGYGAQQARYPYQQQQQPQQQAQQPAQQASAPPNFPTPYGGATSAPPAAAAPPPAGGAGNPYARQAPATTGGYSGYGGYSGMPSPYNG